MGANPLLARPIDRRPGLPDPGQVSGESAVSSLSVRLVAGMRVAGDGELLGSDTALVVGPVKEGAKFAVSVKFAPQLV